MNASDLFTKEQPKLCRVCDERAPKTTCAVCKWPVCSRHKEIRRPPGKTPFAVCKSCAHEGF